MIFSADTIKTFKPDPAVYQLVQRAGDMPEEKVWLVSGNPFDIIGAKACGLKAAWVRRDPARVFDPWEFPPDAVVQNLKELHDVLQTSERVCAVTCVPDEARGERLVVLHLPHPGLEIGPWVRQLSGRGLPNLWVPAERDFYAVPELPVLGSGKVDLKKVKEIALEKTKA